jgi:hypothetical protein
MKSTVVMTTVLKASLTHLEYGSDMLLIPFA